MASKAANRPNRLFYVDALRCFCMLFGIFVHSASIDFNRELALMVFVRDASELFRMSAFFLISGYFTAFVVRPVPLFRFLLNGKRARPVASAAAQASAER